MECKEPNFSSKEIGEPEEPEEPEELSTEESAEKIEKEQEEADFLSGVKMIDAYIKEGIMKSLGKKTKEEVEELVAKNKEIRVEFIPEQLRGNSNKEFAVYEILKERDANSPIEQKIMRDEKERQSVIQKRANERYNSLSEKK